MTAKPITRQCRYHCANCGHHFTSIAAFDAHRHHEIGDSGKGWVGVTAHWCDYPGAVLNRQNEPKLAVVAIGECLLGEVQHDVELWGDPLAADRTRLAFASAPLVATAGDDSTVHEGKYPPEENEALRIGRANAA